jgi:hypothetical protein
MCVWSAHVTLTVLIMRILDRYIVREVFRHAFLGLIVFTFVFFVPQLVRLTALFVRHTGSGAQIAELFLCIFPARFCVHDSHGHSYRHAPGLGPDVGG